MRKQKRRPKRSREEELEMWRELVEREQNGEVLWIRAALWRDGDDPATVTGRLQCTIQYDGTTPEVYIRCDGEEVEVRLDDVDWD